MRDGAGCVSRRELEQVHQLGVTQHSGLTAPAVGPPRPPRASARPRAHARARPRAHARASSRARLRCLHRRRLRRLRRRLGLF
jgi:hypothetical protein